ncbi:MAG: type VI secretion system lipoprotein TssJ [Candidatus Accumulibacter sp.]|jgi:type VI secretion system protein VasD|nr:type VI secretion system lipoprotein TssJ [Accumulibacter sp.]
MIFVRSRIPVCLAFAVFLAAMLSACSLFSTESKREEAVQLDISIQAATDLNPDLKSRPSPMILRVYELKSEATFIQADFFSLQNNDRATLTEDLLARDEFIVRPDDRRVLIRRKAHPQIGALGVFAAFRDLPHSIWRATFRLPPPSEAAWYERLLSSDTIRLRVFLEDNAIRILDD